MKDNSKLEWYVALVLGLIIATIKIAINAYIIYFLYPIIVGNIFSAEMLKYVSPDINYLTAFSLIVFISSFSISSDVKDDKK